MMMENFKPGTQMRQELWDRATEEAERELPKKVTEELIKRVEDGKAVAATLTTPGWRIIEEILINELHMGKLIEDAEHDNPSVVSTYRVGIISGVMKRIYRLPQFAEKATKLLEENAKRSTKNERRRTEQRAARPGRGFFTRGGQREKV